MILDKRRLYKKKKIHANRQYDKNLVHVFARMCLEKI